MEMTIGGFRGTDGVPIHTIAWTGDGNGADVLLAHGYAEHSGRYVHVAQALVESGYDVHALDHVGHGRSGGAMGLVPRFSHTVDDFITHAAAVRRTAAADRPLFLLGHSFGGLVVLDAALRKALPVKAVVTSGAVLRPAVEAPALLLAIAPVASALLPTMRTVTLDANQISTLADEVRKYDEDPFNYRGGIPARTAHEIQTAAARITEALPGVDVPVLLLHGGPDAMASPEGSRVAADLIPESVLTVLEGSFHEIFNDFDRGPAIAEVIAFLDARRGS